jgi:hypothetical protein
LQRGKPHGQGGGTTPITIPSKIHNSFKILTKIHENFSTCNKYIPSSIENIIWIFICTEGGKNGVSMESLILQS